MRSIQISNFTANKLDQFIERQIERNEGFGVNAISLYDDALIKLLAYHLGMEKYYPDPYKDIEEEKDVRKTNKRLASKRTGRTHKAGKVG